MDSERADSVRRQIAAAHAEALRVGDSPLRADRLAATLDQLKRIISGADLGEERTARLLRSCDDALRVLRRDDDGREAAKHLQSGMRLLEGGSGKPSPFLD